MTAVTENVFQRRRGSGGQLFRPDSEHDVLHRNLINIEYNSRFWNEIGGIFSLLGYSTTMNKSAKTALIAIAILVCVIAVILLLSLRHNGACIIFNEEETCYAKQPNPYRLYGTKTAYHIVSGNLSNELNVEGCTPKVFYLYSRHATRYPDEDDIKEMIKLLPDIQNKILNNSDTVKMCKEDLQNLKNWVEKMKPEDDNKISATGQAETILIAQHFKKHFPTLLEDKYSPEKFKFEFTSRERTRSTAEAFAQGLFGDSYKEINFDDSSSNDNLQFHKDCKVMQKRCKYQGFDTSEIEKFKNGTWMQNVIKSVSSRIGIPLSQDDIKTIYKACVFGYALNTGDTWCSLFTSDELKVMEFGEDLDDYYKDAYGNKINYEQACPVVDYVIDLFKSYTNTSKSKVLLQFSHAGGIKKVYSIFGLYKDEKPLTADGICSQENRKWRSSFIAPFTSNLALVLYECNKELKIAAFQNENLIKLGGCSDLFCSYEEFLKMYNPIAEECDLKRICCTCCQD